MSTEISTRLLLILLLLHWAALTVALSLLMRERNRLRHMRRELQQLLHHASSMEGDCKAISENREHPCPALLTSREREIMMLLCEGKSNGEIASSLCVSVNTIKYHIKNIYIKLDVKNRIEALNSLKNYPSG
ncbi:MAG TPA: LuxR C-terminal-related transcriptional regulator [Proteiniphilum sp.]|nr:LuxR C-terminal-related transcriptional regulator [Proteiniphilum sp.]HPJ50964.1 LuxR C-terminal-related transcriptional regulator [Proteiniphilum sp.]HPR20525.1 LuxR C-terminal-related transcriptional regulator [Proteiniphilum sp.]